MNDLGLSPFFSDGMIIQRNSAFPVWTNEKITVSFLDKKYSSIEKDGRWLLEIDVAEAGGPYSLEIYGKDYSLLFNDIYVGDLWLCAGQSNMEMQMARLFDDFVEEWRLDEYPVIRQFKVAQEWDFISPRDNLTGGNWLSVSKETLHEFSAVAWFFAKNLYAKQKEIEGFVPIGLINTAWGGTPIESWMSRDALASYPKIIADGEQYTDTAKNDELAQRTAYCLLEWETNLRHEDVGFALGWQNPGADISGWNEMTLPGVFETAVSKANDNLKSFCGSIWLAKDFSISASFAKSEAKVWLGTIIDADTVYINGTEIGSTGYRYPPRKYLAKNLKEGVNRIVIRVTCNNGIGEVTCDKPFKIFTENETIELSGAWKYNEGAKAPTRPTEFFFQWQPMGNYNAMIAPLLKFPLKGVIWYQGESNESRPHEYADLFKRLITDWREKNRNEKLPFFFVQLPIFNEPSDNCESHNWALIREAQASALSLPHTGMAAAWEHGEWNDIHPINKEAVGYRLFLAAEKYFFGVENTSPGPMVNRYEKKADKLYIYFNNSGTGLITHKGTKTQRSQSKDQMEVDNIASVSVIDGNGEYTRLPAVIEAKDTISIDISHCSLLPDPCSLLYAWADNPRDRQLFNSEGLPVLPFKIELKE